MKLPKISKKTKLTIAQGCGLLLYGLGTAVYGYLNYKEGEQAEWNYIADNADKDGSVFIHDGETTRTDNMYLVYGRKLSEKILNKIRESKDEQENE